MTTQKKKTVTYVTKSPFKHAENQIFAADCLMPDGTPVRDIFEFDLRNVDVKEVLEIQLEAMVVAEVTLAYTQIKVPCIVEHAGLIFKDHESKQYPGGLTKPMWNALDADFVRETHMDGREAAAKAVVAYCDGMSVKTFTGITPGRLTDPPRGNRQFYWDTIFVPDGSPAGPTGQLTYAEICDDTSYGISYKMRKFSQSTKAMISFLDWLRTSPTCALW